MIGWKNLESPDQLQTARDNSFVQPQVIFKHSTRCGVSSGALSRMNQHESMEGVDFYFLDLISFRSLSQQVAETFDVRHESPQVLLIWKGEAVYHESHRHISFDDLQQQVNKLQAGK